jgi:hypothetical protein
MPSLTPLTLTNIAFKNLIGRAMGSTSSDWFAESFPSSFNVTSDNIWLNTIPSSATQAVSNGIALQVVGTFSSIVNSNNHAFTLLWPNTPPSGTDPQTGTSFIYGQGSLLGITGGNVVRNIIPDIYGTSYFPSVTVPGSGVIPSGDARTWYLQYNAGVFYQDNTTGTNPSTASVYVYIGSTLKSQPNTPYTNASYSQNVVGGLKQNSSYTNVSANSIFDMMLYPSLQPSITSFTIQNSSNNYEVGYLQSSGSYTMSWTLANSSNFSANSAIIIGTAGTIIYGPTSNSNPISNTFPNLQFNVPNTLTYSVSILAASGIRLTLPYSITWNYAIYTGQATQSLLSDYNGFLNSYYQTNITGNLFGNYTLPGGTTSFKYILVPDSFATISNILWNNNSVVMADSTDGYTFSANSLNYRLYSYSNPYGVTSNYKIYRSKYKLTATMSNVIIS